MSIENISSSRTKLAEDLKTLSQDVQALVSATASVVGDKAVEARQQVEASLRAAQLKFQEAEQVVAAKGKEALDVADGYVKQNPWKSVGVAAALGFAVGVSFAVGVFSRRS